MVSTPDLERPGKLPHQQGLCEARLGYQDESPPSSFASFLISPLPSWKTRVKAELFTACQDKPFFRSDHEIGEIFIFDKWYFTKKTDLASCQIGTTDYRYPLRFDRSRFGLAREPQGSALVLNLSGKKKSIHGERRGFIKFFLFMKVDLS